MANKQFVAKNGIYTSGNTDVANVNIASGNLLLTSGNITVNTGVISVNAGSIRVGNSSSNVTLYSNGSIFSNGAVFSPGGSVGGSDTQVLFNDGGTVSNGSAAFVFTKTTMIVAVGNSTSNSKVSQTAITVSNSTGNVQLAPGSFTVFGTTAVTAADYLILKASDYTTNKPGLFLGKVGTTANVWDIRLYDGTNNNGTMNLAASTLHHNGSIIWTAANDGTGSTLDADLLDGYEATAFARLAGTPTFTTRTSVVFADTAAISNVSTSKGMLEIQNSSTGAAMMAFYRSGGSGVYFGLDTDNVLKLGGWSFGAVNYKLWHEGNDGTGSTLDADLLDGYEATAFPRLAAAATFTASPLTISTGTAGRVSLAAGNSTVTGSVEFANTSGSRKGYIGLAAEAGTINFVANENSAIGLAIVGNTIIYGIVTATSFDTSSDSKLKKNQSFLYNHDYLNVPIKRYDLYDQEGNRIGLKYGVIAQDVQHTHPHLVSEDQNGYLKLDYNSVIMLMLAELKDKVNAQENYIKHLEVLVKGGK